MDKITLKEIAGYATERTVWRLIGDMAAEGADVWDIGAAAFYALMGVQVFEGKGKEWQKATTPIPKIAAAHGSERLSALIHRSLAFSPEQRPSLETLRNAAANALAEKPQPPRRLTTSEGKAYKLSLVRFWPEEMIPGILRKIVCFCLIFNFHFSFFNSVSAQSLPIPQEMSDIVQRCVDLRAKDNADRVEEAFTYDTRWTLMDELKIDRKGECTKTDKVPTLGLNRMACRIVKLNKGVTNTGGRFRDGRDPRYDYSFLEVTSRKGASLNYDITGRKGHQIFAIVPVANGTPFDASITLNGNPVTSQWSSNGVLYIAVMESVSQQDILHLRIVNKSGKNTSFVIINHNSRKTTNSEKLAYK